MTNAFLDDRSFTKLLQNVASLESFAWNSGVRTTSIESGVSGGFDQILLAYAQFTLEYLELVGSDSLGGYFQLHAFTNLQIIIISNIYLSFPQQPLYALFPDSVTTLGINSQSDKQILVKELHSLLEHKEECECLPHLTLLRVRIAWDPAEKIALRAVSKGVGVRLVALNNSIHNYEALLRT